MMPPELSKIFVYPVKSASEISLNNSILGERGLLNDRNWMVVDNYSRFISQRSCPKMALLKPEIVGGTLRLSAPGMEGLELPLFQKEGKTQMVEIWRDRCEALFANKQPEKWISDFLGKKCNFVFMPNQSDRQVEQKYAIGKNKVAFSDGFPLLLISESSLEDLNGRIDEKISMKRFRPNLVVKNTIPYQEDDWKSIRIGDCVLQLVKPCSRCVLTTVDPETGEKSGREPLKTLAKFRKLNGEIIFGQNLIPSSLGTIEVGMKVEILN
ncbi:MAG: MOSC domain-containing protein [Deltaproteobacteria bacterium]|nr:MOSC domain-containing protein [Deltaproteobacteria bacterium]